jgi:hypothetical protein
MCEESKGNAWVTGTITTTEVAKEISSGSKVVIVVVESEATMRSIEKGK